MDDGSGERDYRQSALVALRSDPEHHGCDLFTRRFRDIYTRRLQIPKCGLTAATIATKTTSTPPQPQ
jgi:hypothetical protein